MDRRGFLKGILAAGIAPAVCKAGILMPGRSIVAQELEVVMPQGLFSGELGTYSSIVFSDEAPAVIVQNQDLATGAYQQFGSVSRIAEAAYAQALYNKLMHDRLFQILRGPQS